MKALKFGFFYVKLPPEKYLFRANKSIDKGKQNIKY